VVQLIPTTLVSLQLDEKNLDNSVAVFSYQSQEIRFGDLPPASLERASICWTLFSHLVANTPTPLQIPQGITADDILRQSLF
jgi:hypothetical protein